MLECQLVVPGLSIFRSVFQLYCIRHTRQGHTLVTASLKCLISHTGLC